MKEVDNMDNVDTFTENDIHLFESIKDRLSCGCENTLWRLIHDLDTRTYRIKCLNCKRYLALRQLYNVDFKTKSTVNTDSQSDFDLQDDQVKTPGFNVNTLEHLGSKIAHIQNLCQDIQTCLTAEAERA